MFRKGISILLALLALFFTVISILAVWDIINIEHIISKTLTTLLIIFISAAVMLFIFSVLYKGGDETPPRPLNSNQNTDNKKEGL
jgi:predicted RND superfamily exporter protein